jgi:hypothetical protein
MKRGILILVLLLVLSGCANIKDYRVNGNQEGSEEDYNEDEEVINDEINSNGGGTSSNENTQDSSEDSGENERTQEEIYEETGCDVNEVIDIIFELVEENATDEEIFNAMCENNCEELNPEEYICQ